MRDVVVVCEGQTEREFCRDVIGPAVGHCGIFLAGTLVGKTNHKRGGIRSWQIYRKEILRLAKERSDRHLAVLVDYYAMPSDWPGRVESKALPHKQRGQHVENMLVCDLLDDLGQRFHPCVQLHEFESLLFVNPLKTAQSIVASTVNLNTEILARALKQVREKNGNDVECINDSPETAPSKWLGKMVTGYDKVAWGIVATKATGLKVLREGCPWLDRWMTRIESLGEND